MSTYPCWKKSSVTQSTTPQLYKYPLHQLQRQQPQVTPEWYHYTGFNGDHLSARTTQVRDTRDKWTLPNGTILISPTSQSYKTRTFVSPIYRLSHESPQLTKSPKSHQDSFTSSEKSPAVLPPYGTNFIQSAQTRHALGVQTIAKEKRNYRHS